MSQSRLPDGGQAVPVRRTVRQKRGYAVFAVVATCDFMPQRPWTWPERFGAAKLVAKNLTAADALGFARAFNKRQLLLCQAGGWDHRWAIVTRHLRPRRGLVRQEGGAA